MAKLRLCHALSLRKEQLQRIKHLEAVVKPGRNDGFLGRPTTSDRLPATGMDPAKVRSKIAATRTRCRRLNAAIQALNLGTTVCVGGERMTLAEALELRKETEEEVERLELETVEASHITRTHLEHKVVETSPRRSYPEARDTLGAARLRLRALRRLCAEATFALFVDFEDDPDTPEFAVETQP